MPKHEYEIYVEYREVHSVFVEAESEEEAIELALDLHSDGKTEIHYSSTDATVNWSDEEY